MDLLPKLVNGKVDGIRGKKPAKVLADSGPMAAAAASDSESLCSLGSDEAKMEREMEMLNPRRLAKQPGSLHSLRDQSEDPISFEGSNSVEYLGDNLNLPKPPQNLKIADPSQVLLI